MGAHLHLLVVLQCLVLEAFCSVLLSFHAVDQEPQSFLDGKLLVSKKRQLVEVEDILTWTKALTIYQMVICASHPHCWSDLTKYKLMIIQTACQSPGRAWLEYDLAFQKDAAATGASDWSRDL